MAWALGRGVSGVECRIIWRPVGLGVRVVTSGSTALKSQLSATHNLWPRNLQKIAYAEQNSGNVYIEEMAGLYAALAAFLDFLHEAKLLRVWTGRL